MSNAIETHRLTKYYGKNCGIENLTLTVPAGSTYGFLGPNGAGKTTTIRCLLGLLRPSVGSARVLGETVRLDGAKLRMRIGYVAGEVHLYDRETGRWHIDYLSGLRGSKPISADELCQRLGFDPSRPVKQLSKGNKQKLALVLALMHDPELLMLDEPTSGLDPLNQQTVFEIVAERVASGATLFLSSHILSEVEKACQRVAVVRDGKIVAEENMADMLAKRIRRVEVSFLEPVAADLLDGIEGVTDVERYKADTLRATVRGDAINEVVRRLAQRRIDDLEIERASLEEVFMEYYRSDSPASRAADVAGPGSEPESEGGT